jgi:[acyl-carrier-protein] S-malonyltransferase
MQEAVPVGTGAMAAILGIERADLEAICAETAQGEVVAPANFNSPGQIVIAGHASAVARTIEAAKGRGYRKAMLLPVSAPFHCALMRPAAERLKAVLETIAVCDPQLPVISNVEARPNRDGQRVKELLVAQVCAPVRWDESVLQMAGMGVTRFVEIGPGKVLSGLVKRIAKEAEVVNCEDLATLNALRTD